MGSYLKYLVTAYSSCLLYQTNTVKMKMFKYLLPLLLLSVTASQAFSLGSLFSSEETEEQEFADDEEIDDIEEEEDMDEEEEEEEEEEESLEEFELESLEDE